MQDKTLTLDFETCKQKIKEKNARRATLSPPMDQHKHSDILATNRKKKNLKLTSRRGYKCTQAATIEFWLLITHEVEGSLPLEASKLQATKKT